MASIVGPVPPPHGLPVRRARLRVPRRAHFIAYTFYATLLLRRLEEQKGASVAMGEWFNFFTYVRAGGHLYGRGGGVLVASQLC